MSAGETASDLAQKFEESLSRTLDEKAVLSQAVLMGAISVRMTAFWR
jgi:hypothetical protein